MQDLKEYRRKRRFDITPEPAGKVDRKNQRLFVVQKHAATRLHYDLRLEVDGVMKSWAVPKGPSLNPGDKRLAIQVEDHPLEYRTFEGVIPEGQYGAGQVIIWDEGTYEPEANESAAKQLERGELKFRLFGKKLRGSFVLVRLRRSEKNNEWLLIKHRDEYADPNWNADQHDESVVSGRTLEDIKEGKRPTKKGKSPTPKITGAQKAAMPAHVSPTLATLADKPFSDPNWLFEVKWDGVRAISYLDRGKTRILSRTGRDITKQSPEFHNLDHNISAEQAIVDGEIVTLDASGRSDFQKLQNRIGASNPSEKLLEAVPLTYYVFDVVYCDGYDLRKSPLLERIELLRQILRPTDNLRFSEHQLEKGKELFDAAREKGLEGIVGKQTDSPYTGNRTSYWLKFKNVKELDAVIAGWTAPRRTRQYFGALVLGLYEGKELKFIGSVGTGFDQKTQQEILAQLKELRVAKSPFRNPPKLREHVEWVRPKLVARVKYGNFTEDRRLRAPVFLGIRKDRLPEDCTFSAAEPAHVAHSRPRHAEKPKHASVSNGAQPSMPANAADPISSSRSETLDLEVDGHPLHLTNLNKIYFPESGITKRDLLAYYYRMADYILPFVKDRPMVLRRYPNGIQGKSFFQKEAPKTVPSWIQRVPIYSDERGGKMDYFLANDRASLLYLTNLGCIDHNPWSSRASNPDIPDYVFLDLDPTPGTPFSTVLRVARSVHKLLKAVHLKSFLKTSGATGFHIYVPLEASYTYEQTRTFAQIVGELVSAELPNETTLERTVRKRPPGRVLIDALQNALGKPLACVYSVRAFPRAPVSAPVSPEEMEKKFVPEEWNLRTMEKRLEGVGDLWRDFWKSRQTLDKALDLLSHNFGKAPRSEHRITKNRRRTLDSGVRRQPG
jgi:bifunctional non-homologous end joining protein LigD